MIPTIAKKLLNESPSGDKPIYLAKVNPKARIKPTTIPLKTIIIGLCMILHRHNNELSLNL